MKEVLGSLPEVITAYKNYNLLVPTATDVQLNPFYKFHVEEVPVDLGETSGDIFKVGSVKTGKQDERGKDIWEDVFSLSKPLLNKMAMAAGIQFNPKETYGERIDRVTYRAQAQGAMRKADGTARTETDQKVICLEDEEDKYRIEFSDKAAKGIVDEKQAQAAAEIFSGQWVESKNKWGKKCQAFVVAKEDREGDCKAWIRGTEDARSGSIEFIFDIGEKRFRVVRTRTKSGKPTLNLSQYQEESADWMNLSKERIVDTQAEIEKLLGMDSMTFRSCALIMQDQYGLFLQAKKDERIAILPIYQEVLNYNGRSNGMIKILLSKKLGEMRLTQADLARATGIRPNTINELYHELADRVNLEHLDLICEALDCELDELIVRVPNKESAITHTRQGTQKPGRKR